MLVFDCDFFLIDIVMVIIVCEFWLWGFFFDGYCDVDSWGRVLCLMVIAMAIMSVSFVMTFFDGHCDGESCVCVLIVTRLFDVYCDGDSWGNYWL